ncbi:hypothetical protein B0H10DRAFT_2230781 [Mycena sp. CBHHK59/15]|nr:hypothetical protein B0H10DRAFT_2230781 [Mycena sp. CBHHK59/15]
MVLTTSAALDPSSSSALRIHIAIHASDVAARGALHCRPRTILTHAARTVSRCALWARPNNREEIVVYVSVVLLHFHLAFPPPHTPSVPGAAPPLHPPSTSPIHIPLSLLPTSRPLRRPHIRPSVFLAASSDFAVLTSSCSPTLKRACTMPRDWRIAISDASRGAIARAATCSALAGLRSSPRWRSAGRPAIEITKYDARWSRFSASALSLPSLHLHPRPSPKYDRTPLLPNLAPAFSLPFRTHRLVAAFSSHSPFGVTDPRRQRWHASTHQALWRARTHALALVPRVWRLGRLDYPPARAAAHVGQPCGFDFDRLWGTGMHADVAERNTLRVGGDSATEMRRTAARSVVRDIDLTTCGIATALRVPPVGRPTLDGSVREAFRVCAVVLVVSPACDIRAGGGGSDKRRAPSPSSSVRPVA